MRKANGQTLKRNIAAHYFLKVAALLACQNRGRVNLGKNALCLECVRQQFSAAHAVAHILQNGTEEDIALALNEQFQRLNDGQAGMDQGNELLVEDDELLLLDLAAPRQIDLAGEQAFRLDGVDEIALLGKAIADLRLRGAVLDLLQNVAPLVGHLDGVFGHYL